MNANPDSGRDHFFSSETIVQRRGRGEKNEGEIDNTEKEATPTVETDEEREQRLLGEVRAMIAAARDANFNVAADNFEYWLSGSEGTRTLPASVFENQEFINQWLMETPMRRFAIGIQNRIASGQVVSGDLVPMHWIDSLNAPTDNELFYGLGGFTIRSDITVRVQQMKPEEGGGWLVHILNWTCTVTDEYNWDPNKTTDIPGFGNVPDSDMRWLESRGHGAPFHITSEPWNFSVPGGRSTFAVEP